MIEGCYRYTPQGRFNAATVSVFLSTHKSIYIINYAQAMEATRGHAAGRPRPHTNAHD